MSRPAAAAWRCTSCANTPKLSSRSFSISSTTRKIGPESPRYIDIPSPPQQTFKPRPRIKGVLPVPRDIFHKRRGGIDKVTPSYLDTATYTPAPSDKRVNKHDPEAARNDWKAQMADKRRQNLREGLTELHQRRVVSDAASARRTARRQAERQRLIEAAEREDERLTNPTTTLLMQSIASENGQLPDPNRETRLAEMRARVAEKEAAKASERQDALHTLYMHAKDFIVTEAQLEKAIDAAFGTANEPKTFGNRHSSVWAEQLPQSIQDKLNAANRSRGTVADSEWIATTTNQRIGKIAEQLTGGKMENVS